MFCIIKEVDFKTHSLVIIWPNKHPDRHYKMEMFMALIQLRHRKGKSIYLPYQFHWFSSMSPTGKLTALIMRLLVGVFDSLINKLSPQMHLHFMFPLFLENWKSIP